MAAVSAAIMIIFTLAANVPINKRTQDWDPEHPPADWQQERRRWHTYQGVHAVLLAVWLLAAVAATTLV